ncbi:Vps53-like protein [Entophlyctis helioformis]|nr:Vps53-like protein [Entophlyctis helioformis]
MSAQARAGQKLTIGTGFSAAKLGGTAAGGGGGGGDLQSPAIDTSLLTDTQKSSMFGPASTAAAADFEEGNHDIIRLSADIDRQLSKILTHSDALDTSDLNAIEYVNNIFPNEQSLSAADKVLDKLKRQIKMLDKELKDLVRHQTDASQQTRQELVEVKQAILDLVSRIKAIKSRAGDSEQLVLEITHDIKSLDRAKKNLTHTINVLRRLQMFVNALEQLKGVANRKQYRETAHLLQVVLELVKHFKAFKNVKQVAALCDAVAQFQTEMKRTIFNEFEASFINGTYKHQAQVLNDACLVVESMDFDAKTPLVDWYCDLQLKDYRSIFRNNPEVAGLGDISRRYAWLKRTLKTHDEQHANLFPHEWQVAECLTVTFCDDTRKDLSDILARTDKDNTLDTIQMLQAIQATMEFESKVDKRFTARDPTVLVRDENELAPKTSKFYKIISSCFEMYLWRFIDMEDRALAEKFDGFKSQAPTADEEAVLLSSTELFLFYRQSLVNCARLSTRKAFLDLCKMFGKWLKNYNDILLGKLPKDERRVPTEDDIRIICFVINTADYCSSTTGQLEEKLTEKIDAEFKGLLSMSAEKDAFMNTCVVAVQALVRAIENANETAFTAMIKRPWGTISSVGDQSEHITMIAANLSSAIRIIRRTITASKFFRVFCDKFAESFIAKYLANIYKCRPLSEVGAEQMLLDTHSLKNILLEMSTLGADPPTQPPPAYVKILSKGISKVEQLLKVVLRPQDPPDILVDTYNLLYQDYNTANFQKILELKGLRRSEMQQILDVFQIKIPAGTQPTSPQPPGGPSDPNAKLSMGNFKPDFRKFMNNMNMKRT